VKRTTAPRGGGVRSRLRDRSDPFLFWSGKTGSCERGYFQYRYFQECVRRAAWRQKKTSRKTVKSITVANLCPSSHHRKWKNLWDCGSVVYWASVYTTTLYTM